MAENVERRIGSAMPSPSRKTDRASQPRRFRAEGTLRRQFQRHLLAKLREAESLTRDNLGSICNLIEDLGAVEVARMLVDPVDVTAPPTGFLRLLEHELGRLTIEQAIVDSEETGLFTDEEVVAAKARLSIFRNRRTL